VWTESAQLSLSRGKTKLYIDIEDNNSISNSSGSSLSSLSLNSLSSYSSAEKKQKLHNQNRQRPPRRRLKFAIDQTLRIEHNVPLAKDFHVTLSGGGALIRHKVAFFAEDEAAAVVSLLGNRGVQVIRKRGDRSKKDNFSSGLRPISEGFEGVKTRRTSAPPKTCIGTMAILRRKSTGSFDKQQSHLDQRQSQRQLKNSMSTIETISSALLQRRNSMASRSKKADSRMVAAAESPKKSSKTAQQTTKWYEEIDYYDEEEIEFNRETSTAKNSRHSLETDEDSSEHEEKEDLIEDDAEATDEADGIMGKLFHPSSRSPPPHQPQPQNQPHRPRAPTSEKLEKYKFMLINIEDDPDILDPGTFALMQDSQDSSSYMGFEFNDYPAEVLCPPFHPTTQQQEEEADSVSSINSCCSGGASGGCSLGGSNSTTSNTSPKPKPNRTSFDLQPTWIRRSYEQLHSIVSVRPASNLVCSSSNGGGGNYSSIKNLKFPANSQSTGNLVSSHKSCATGASTRSRNTRETNTGKAEQNEQQSETNDEDALAYNSESGSNKEAGGGGQLQQDIRRQLLSSGSPTLTSECL